RMDATGSLLRGVCRHGQRGTGRDGDVGQAGGRRRVGDGARQRDREHGTTADGVVDAYRAAVRAGDDLDDVQPQAAAAPGLVGAVEPLEHRLFALVRHARAVVAHPDLQIAAAHAAADLYVA